VEPGKWVTLFVQSVGQVQESMPWKVMDVVDERTRFVLEYDSGSFTMAELCRIYGIARKTGYVWVERYEAEGLAGLQDRRYGAGNHPNQTDSGIEEQIVQLKQVHPSWGAKKLRAHLLAKKKGVKWPVVIHSRERRPGPVHEIE
jgi:transposase